MISIERLAAAFVFYIWMGIGATTLFFYEPGYLGLFTVFLSVFFILKTGSFLVFILSFYNVMVGFAFDYFLRVRPHAFEFYFWRGATVEYLSFLSVISYMVIVWLSDGRTRGFSRSLTINARLPEFSNIVYYPFLLSIVVCIVFLLKNERTILGGDFDLRELVKYPFLEYFGIIVLFTLGSANRNIKKEYFAYVASFLLVIVCLATSYRMVAIVIGLSIFFFRYRGSQISKSLMILAGACCYSILMIISYIRLGVSDIEVSSLLGYVDGRLDNTFSGVIETALIYTSVSATQDLGQNLMHLIGTIMPLPSSFLPESTSYVRNLFSVYPTKIPGGGLLAGFFIYFNYLLVIPVFLFMYFALRYSSRNALFGSMYFICFICVSRWWLYGPFVFFKFAGIFTFFYLLNSTILMYERTLFRRSLQ